MASFFKETTNFSCCKKWKIQSLLFKVKIEEEKREKDKKGKIKICHWNLGVCNIVAVCVFDIGKIIQPFLHLTAQQVQFYNEDLNKWLIEIYITHCAT